MRKAKSGMRLHGLEAELRKLEQTDPAVKAAREALDDLPNQFARMKRHDDARRAAGKREVKP